MLSFSTVPRINNSSTNSPGSAQNISSGFRGDLYLIAAAGSISALADREGIGTPAVIVIGKLVAENLAHLPCSTTSETLDYENYLPDLI